MEEGSHRHTWMLYGASGYTGRLILREALQRGITPVLAGRDEGRLTEVARGSDCETRVFSLDDPAAVSEGIRGCTAVLHCAGPFSQTAGPMLDACLAGAIHYLDITGEVPVLEHIYARHDAAVDRGIVLLPACGFDVVPTECLASMLKKRMPDATRLRLAFKGALKQSPGTWKTTLESIPRGGLVRKNGELMQVPHAWKAKRMTFHDSQCWTMTIPWGDLASAYRSTGIRDIEVYACQSRSGIMLFRSIRGIVTPLLGKTSVRRALHGTVGRRITGPGDVDLKQFEYAIRGDVWNGTGEQQTLYLRTPEAYALTADAALASVEGVLAGKASPGAHTPSTAFGDSFVLGLQGVELYEHQNR